MNPIIVVMMIRSSGPSRCTPVARLEHCYAIKDDPMWDYGHLPDLAATREDRLDNRARRQRHAQRHAHKARKWRTH